MADILGANQNFKRALHDIEDLKIHEDDYGKINKLQNILNSFVALSDIANSLIDSTAKNEGLEEAAIIEGLLSS